jgi:hypothetical protein
MVLLLMKILKNQSFSYLKIKQFCNTSLNECWPVTQFGWLESSIPVPISKNRTKTGFDIGNQNQNLFEKLDLVLEPKTRNLENNFLFEK